MDIRQYINASERSYSYRVKSCIPLEDGEMGRIERAILKYDPVNLTNPTKTIFQSQPLDFPNVQNVEVYFVDMELGLPVSPSVLVKEIAAAIGAPEKFVVVRGSNDPTELETQRLNAEQDMADEAAKSGLEQSPLLTDAEYSEVEAVEADTLYGNKHASRLVAYLNKVNQERTEAQKVDPPSPLFKWLDMPKGDANQAGDEFNKDIADAPRVEGVDEPVGVAQSLNGNMVDTGKYRRVFKTKDGSKKVMDRTADSVTRKGK